MCGFLGQFNTPNLPETEFRGILKLGQFRGPDQTGYWASDGVQFGFNRLSILDLSEAGNQPMHSSDGDFTLMFNGEIYNHLELRKTLGRYNYKGHSDTETILRAIETWGFNKAVEALDGMFAIALYDHKKNSVSLARDFAGIKPLFYGWNGKELVFASQYDQITNHPVYKDQSIDESVLKLYLQQHFMPAPFGLYKNTGQLNPGEIKTFDASGNMSSTFFWSLPDVSDEITDQQEALDLFSLTLSSAVKDEMISDVPLGAFLSGGVDSPLICAYAAQENPGIKSFTIGSDSSKHDESDRASQFAKALNLQHFLWKLKGKEVLNHWESAIGAIHEPIADFSIIPTFLVSKLARKEVTVALSGDGGDELFYGYERFWSIAKNQRYQSLPSAVKKGIYGADKYLFGNKYVNSNLLYSQQGQAHEHLHSRFREKQVNLIYPQLRDVNLPEPWTNYSYENSSSLNGLFRNMQKAEFYGMMQKTLRKVDLASMQNSLEVRVPFLKKSVIECAWKISPALSTSKGAKKQFLKDLLAKEIPSVPSESIKKGFSTPLGKWIREDLKDIIYSELTGPQLSRIGLEKKELIKMWDDHQGGHDRKWPIFTLYALSKCLK